MTDNTGDRLAQLQKLFDEGLITEAEYQERRQQALDDMMAKPAEVIPPPPAPAATPLDQAPPKKKAKVTGGQGCLIIVVFVAVLALFGSMCGDGNGDSGGGGSSGATFRGTVTDYFPDNPASLTVVISMTNTGTKAANWQCNIRAQDSSGAYSGFDILSSNTALAPGASDTYRGNIIITNEGAAFVTEVKLTDCEQN